MIYWLSERTHSRVEADSAWSQQARGKEYVISNAPTILTATVWYLTLELTYIGRILWHNMTTPNYRIQFYSFSDIIIP